MSEPENGDTGLTAAEAAELRRQLAELQQSFKDLREASTATERKQAREDVADEREDLDKLAKRLGISKQSLEKATAEAKRAERKEELRPLLEEILAELAETDDEEPEPEPKPKRKPRAKKEPADTGDGEGDDEQPPADTSDDDAPVTDHWSDKVIHLWG